MTKEEIRKVLDILSTADGGCSVCEEDLILRFGDAFPEYKVLIHEMSKYEEKEP